MSEEDARTRAERRAQWPIARNALGQEPAEDLRATTSPSQRLEMMWQLAIDAWAMSGRALPNYARHEMPGRVYRSFDERNAESATGRAKDLADIKRLEEP